MVAGRAFLGKKSFHPGTLRNAELVWAAEQAAAEEKRKTEEIRQRILEEREKEDLQQRLLDGGMGGMGSFEA
jgi:hypothetical protein